MVYNVSSFSSQGRVSDRSDSLPCPSALRFWEGWLCLDVPSVATAVWCFGAAFPPWLWTKQQGTMFILYSLKKYFGVMSDSANKNKNHIMTEVRGFLCFFISAFLVDSEPFMSLFSSLRCWVLPPCGLSFLWRTWLGISWEGHDVIPHLAVE